jgi:hypothetical protein
MIKDFSIIVHIILFLYKTQHQEFLYLSRDKHFQYVSPHNAQTMVSATERKDEARKIPSTSATRQRTSGVDRQHFLFLCVTGLHA